jgi:hypothetical protein
MAGEDRTREARACYLVGDPGLVLLRARHHVLHLGHP